MPIRRKENERFGCRGKACGVGPIEANGARQCLLPDYETWCTTWLWMSSWPGFGRLRGRASRKRPVSAWRVSLEERKLGSSEKLAPKTAERCHDQAGYIDPELLAMSLTEITPLHLHREWSRLLKCGGHTRKDKTPRPLSP